MVENELAVVMPVYNEHDAISNVVNKWTNELEKLDINFEFHIYNDGSTDNTLQILKDLAVKNEKIIIHNKENSGHGPTILLGYRDNSMIEWIFQTDSDDEMESKYFLELWKNKGDFDLVIGRRENRGSPVSRRIMTFVARIMVRILYGSNIIDVNSPYRLYRTEKFYDIFKIIPSNTFAPNVILSGCAARTKAKVLELPVPCQQRITGEVSIKKLKLFKAAFKSWIQTIKFRFSKVILENKID